ncbi:hypothetical protein C2E20_3435 [Micractinium conductrix]|uniref:Uncharacterized protein n=1 Tax=Micractinium conductrix TaxID=554055 RepID=A0A2P6VGK3_9CHLO|nr:hypothetical protein C2E20_3435 [Micractinium conductrix]|eukprot:PSC73224.1 hypothetical protein C2E20_3435 [Micractinium conductrix]
MAISSSGRSTNWTPINIALIVAILVVLVVWPPWEPQGVTTFTEERPAKAAGAAGAAGGSAAPSRPGVSMCDMAGTRYECSNIFDWHFYTSFHPDLSSISAAEAFNHWWEHGIKETRRVHAGQRIVKIVLITKDEWPLVRSWVLYHAHVFGGENIYVIDGSSDKAATSFLKQAECQLGVHVFRSNAGLATLGDDMTKLMRSLGLSADYLVKMDTDEFLALSRADASGARSFIVGPAVRDYVDSFGVREGKPLVVTQYADTVPSQACSDDPTAATAYLPSGPRSKLFIRGPTFVATDLGGQGEVLRLRPGFQATPEPAGDLQILHASAACYENWTANNKRACVSLGHIAETDSDAVARPKLEAKKAEAGDYPGKAQVAGYLAHIVDPAAAKQAYYARFTGAPTTFTGLRDLVGRLRKEYEAEHAGGLREAELNFATPCLAMSGRKRAGQWLGTEIDNDAYWSTKRFKQQEIAQGLQGIHLSTAAAAPPPLPASPDCSMACSLEVGSPPLSSMSASELRGSQQQPAAMQCTPRSESRTPSSAAHPAAAAAAAAPSGGGPSGCSAGLRSRLSSQPTPMRLHDALNVHPTSPSDPGLEGSVDLRKVTLMRSLQTRLRRGGGGEGSPPGAPLAMAPLPLAAAGDLQACAAQQRQQQQQQAQGQHPQQHAAPAVQAAGAADAGLAGGQAVSFPLPHPVAAAAAAAGTGGSRGGLPAPGGGPCGAGPTGSIPAEQHPGRRRRQQQQQQQQQQGGEADSCAMQVSPCAPQLM